ncbi:MAG: cyclic nucleotide-binding domain-containing protein [Nodosilinea sp.]
MDDILLRELANADLDWMADHGVRSSLAPGEVLIDPKQPQRSLYLLISGQLGLTFPDAAEGAATVSPELVEQIVPGEIVGAAPLFEAESAAQVVALTPAQVLALNLDLLQVKLRQDVPFAARLYRAIAVMYTTRLRRIFAQPGRVRLWGSHSRQEALTIFCELYNSDLDWLVSFGEIQTLRPGQLLVRAGRPVDALYVVLDGKLAVSAPAPGLNPLELGFVKSDQPSQGSTAFATIDRGELPGIISFLDLRPMPVTMSAQQETYLLAVPRPVVTTKLQVDGGFAIRFYRVIVGQILDLLQTVGESLATEPIPPLPEAQDGAMNGQGMADLMDDLMDEMENEELALESLQNLSEGAAKFNWMLQRLGVSHG